MKRKTLMMSLLFAAVAMTGMADVPMPKYHYHALPFPEWFAQKAGLPSGLGLALCLGMLLSLAFVILHYLKVHRKSNCTFLNFVHKQWPRVFLICPLCWAGYFIFFEILPTVELSGVYGGDVSVLVKPDPNESYSQYMERVRRQDNDLCLKCGTKIEHWYWMGRHSGCPKCEKLHEEGICRVCGKEYKRFVGRNREVARGSELGVCDNCINLERKGYPAVGTDL